MDQTSSELKKKVTELSERYADAQREISQLISTRNSLQEEAQSLTNKIESLEESLSKEKEKSMEVKQELQQKIQQLQQELINKAEEHQKELLDEKNQLEAANSKLLQLKAENFSLMERVKTDSSSSAELNDYKKRAQQAIKKANHASTILTEKNKALLDELEEMRKIVSETRENSIQKEAEMGELHHQLHAMQ